MSIIVGLLCAAKNVLKILDKITTKGFAFNSDVEISNDKFISAMRPVGQIEIIDKNVYLQFGCIWGYSLNWK